MINKLKLTTMYNASKLSNYDQGKTRIYLIKSD